MSEVQTEAAAGGEGAGGDGTGGDPAAGGGGEAGARPAWMDALPDELKGDATLARYKDVGELAKGFVETKRVASSRLVVPGEGADEAAWGAFWDQIGRPKEAAGYDVPVPEGMDTAYADAFRPVAHQLGLTAAQAKGLAEWNNGQHDALLAKGAAEVEAVKAATPDYDRRMAAARSTFLALGGDAAIADGLDAKLGSGALVKFMLNLGAKAGEHPRVDGEQPGFGAGGDPDATLTAKSKDASWRERAKIEGTPEHAEYNRLVAAAAAKRGGGR